MHKLNLDTVFFKFFTSLSQNSSLVSSSHRHSQTPLGAESWMLFHCWGFPGHHDDCFASCCSLEGNLRRIFSKLLDRKEWHSIALTPVSIFFLLLNCPLESETQTDQTYAIRPTQQPPHKHKWTLSVMSGCKVLFPAVRNKAFLAYALSKFL